ncbi:hypothetical protein ABZ615_07645 [Streptomyces sp. NPDC007325]|uniref:hypothetical protein n=1 Tax=unclassified Streptomyces TaxID=2593676 RepID=UPI0033FCE1EA
MRTEQRSEDDIRSVLLFRLERYDDAGRRVMLVPVEMRGLRFEGSVHDGDWVRVSGRMRAGTLHANEVHNATTGADVNAKRTPKWQWILATVIICIIAAIIVSAWIGVFAGEPAGPPDDWPPENFP